MTKSQMGESAIIEYAAATTMPATAEACFNVTVKFPFGIFGLPLGGRIIGLASTLGAICGVSPNFTEAI